MLVQHRPSLCKYICNTDDTAAKGADAIIEGLLPELMWQHLMDHHQLTPA